MSKIERPKELWMFDANGGNQRVYTALSVDRYIESLEAERDAYKNLWAQEGEVTTELEAENEELSKLSILASDRLKQLQKLKEYARHKKDCPSRNMFAPPKDCNCGLDELLKP